MDTKDKTNISKGFGVDENTALVVTNTLANPTGKVSYVSLISLLDD